MTVAADRRWLIRALRLATLSCGRTWPNPGVGSVVVRDGALLGDGRHEVCGQAHAEVNALANCRVRGHDPRGATVYVTLAPCTRQGRQPPCVDALRAAGVARVVAALVDANQDDPAAILAASGIAYDLVELPEAEHLHGGFRLRIDAKRPRFTGKWAMTLDGCIAAAGGDSRWISSPEALALARRRRRGFDAILVGAGTARSDDPHLLAVPRRERTPLRIVLSQRGRLDPQGRMASGARTAPVLVVHGPLADRDRLAALGEQGVALLAVDDAHDARAVGAALGRHGLNDVLVEGGAAVHGAWLRAGLYDRVEIYLAARSLGGGVGAASGSGVSTVANGAAWEHEEPPRMLGDTVLLRLRRR